MAIVYVFNDDTGRIEKYSREYSDPMPYNISNTLTVREFLNRHTVGWTDLYTMNAWNKLRNYYGAPIIVKSAFSTMNDNGCLPDPQFYFGMGFLISPIKSGDAEKLHEAAVESEAFSFVAPFVRGEDILVDNRYKPANLYLTSGLPNLFRGVRCNQVFGVQDSLKLFGYNIAVDGIFGPETERAVIQFQRNCGLTEDGIMTYLEWNSLLATGCLVR